MDRTDHTTRRSFEGTARNYYFYGGLIWIFCHKFFPKNPPGGTHWWTRAEMSCRDRFSPPLALLLQSQWSYAIGWDIFCRPIAFCFSFAGDLAMLFISTLYKNNSFVRGAFKTASSGMIRSVHGTHPLIFSTITQSESHIWIKLLWIINIQFLSIPLFSEKVLEPFQAIF